MWKPESEQIADFEYEFDQLRVGLALEESEETWDKIGDTLQNLTSLINSYSDVAPQLATSLKPVARYIGKALLSERSRLCGTAVECTCALATHMQRSFETLVPFLVPPLISLASKPHKLSISRAKSCLQCIAEFAQIPSLIPHLRAAIANKSSSLRLVAIDVAYTCLNCYNPTDLEAPARAEDIEEIIRKTARDANADVRKSSRKVFEAYKILLPNRVDTFVKPLTPTVRKYLDVKNQVKNSKPVPSSANNRPPAGVTLFSSSRTQNVPPATSRPADKGGTRPEKPLAKSTNLEDDPRLTRTILEKAEVEKPPRTGPIRPPFPPSMQFNIPKEATQQRARAIRVIPPAIPEKRYVPPEVTSSRAVRPISVELQRPPPQVAIPTDSSKAQTNLLKRSGAQRPTREELEKGRSEAKAMTGTVQTTKLMSSSLPETTLKPLAKERVGRPEGSRHKPSASEGKIMYEKRETSTKDLLQARPPSTSSSNPNLHTKEPRKEKVISAKNEQKCDVRKVNLHLSQEPTMKKERKNPDLKSSTVTEITRPPFSELIPLPADHKGKAKQQVSLPPPPNIVKSPVKMKKGRAGPTAPTLSQLARKNEAAKDAARRRSLEKQRKALLVKIRPLVIKKKPKGEAQTEPDRKQMPKNEDTKQQLVAPGARSEEPSGRSTGDLKVPKLTFSQVAENPVCIAQDRPNLLNPSFSQPLGFLTPGKPPVLPLKPGIIPPTPISSLFLKIQQGFEDSQGAVTLPFPTNVEEDEERGDGGETDDLARIDFLMDGVNELGFVIKSPRREDRLPANTKKPNDIVKIREVECRT